MSTVFTFAILGLAAGALYVLFGLGLVIIHRGSGVVNFAHGAVGMVGTFAAWKLHEGNGFPYLVALVAGVLVSGALGLLIHLLIMRPMRGSAVLTRVIATLAVLTILQEGMVKLYSGPSIVVAPGLPNGPVTMLGATVGRDRLLILVLVLVLTAGLAALYSYTQFGRATAAATENPRALAALGRSPNLVAAGNWFLGSALAGLAGILLAPITNLSVTGFTLLVVPALAAAVVGRLASFPLTMVGGLAIGIIQAEVGRFVDAPGWAEAVPFLAMIVVLMARGHDRTIRTQVAQRLPRLGTGRVRWYFVLIWLVVGVALIESVPPEWNDAVTTTIGTGLIVLSLVVVTGYSGQLSLAQFAFAGWGAWIAGGLARSFDVPFLPAIVIGALATLPLGLLVGAVCLRTRGVNLAIATLGMAVALDNLVFSNPARTAYGAFVVPTPAIGGLELGAIVYPDRYALVVLVVFVACGLAIANLRRGRGGRRLVAVRSNERAAASLGINVVQAKLAAFAFSSVIAGLGGCLLAFRNPSIVFANYGPLQSIKMVGYAVVGGIGWIAGAVYGGLLEVGALGAKLLDQLGPDVGSYLPLAGGVLLIVMLLRAPDGLASQGLDHARHLVALVRPAGERAAPANGVPAVPKDDTAQRVRPQELELVDLSVSFGGVRALSGANLRIGPGEIVGLIGPNGAGKTTLIDTATGFVRAGAGQVRLGGKDITGASPSARARAGLTRSFQSLELFDDLTVLDNLRAAAEPRDGLAYLLDALWPRTPPLTAVTTAAIEEFGLEPYLHKTPTELPYGIRRLVGIARSVATGASVIALDEPAAGLDQAESRELAELLRGLADRWGVAILLVEHNVELVLGLCDRVYALNFGEVIAAGTPAQVRGDRAVIAAYLGDDRDDYVTQS
ncbi:ATP-binding cassette domain-containing protein [Nocardia sp. NPDC049526]|uniref:ABC transporter permease subunit n=1 Tax=Nocardia sp. NPDC049526 TaxID=3364316 RepID=UPI0037A97F04